MNVTYLYVQVSVFCLYVYICVYIYTGMIKRKHGQNMRTQGRPNHTEITCDYGI